LHKQQDEEQQKYRQIKPLGDIRAISSISPKMGILIHTLGALILSIFRNSENTNAISTKHPTKEIQFLLTAIDPGGVMLHPEFRSGPTVRRR